MTAVVCGHGMPSPASCTDCMWEGNLEPVLAEVRPERVVLRKPARFAGHCPGCNLPIEVGQVIVLTTEDHWLHDGCQP